ncbi:MAG: FAD-dependent monooxygenase [Pseudolabrys sp.]|nr:FAD-dependent monooxygenase [Pseudolabrys sp.]
MASDRHVLISGGGIGGLTAALALARAGMRVTVFEQAPRLEEAGAGIQLSPNATRVLIALGLGEPLKVTAVEPLGIRVLAGRSAREIVRIPLGPSAEKRYGAPYWVIHRGDLQNALAEAARANPDITLSLATRVEDFAPHSNGISIQGRRLGQVVEERALALVAADGLWSPARALLRRQAAPTFRHKTAWRALVPAQDVPPQWRLPFVHLWLGPDAHLVHYPVKAGALINIVAIVDDEFREEGWSATGETFDILRHFARWSWCEEARDLIAVPERWQKWALFDRKSPARGSGPITLLGDAAHPSLPFLAQGGAMAIEDAAVLAANFVDNIDDPVKVLRAYERARRKRTAKVQRAARRQGRIYGRTGPEALVRNLVMKMMGGEKLLAHYDWLYGWKPPVFEFAHRHVTQVGDSEGAQES